MAAGAVLINYGGDHVLRAAGGTLQARGESVEGDTFQRFRAEIISDEFLEEIFTPGFRSEGARARADLAAQTSR